MVGFIPEVKVDLKSDDIQSIERDPQKLAQRYLSPIDAIRSIARPIPGTSKNQDECVFEIETDNSRPLESRAHAFLRYVGFPVAVKPDLFYNPGFDPFGSLEKTRRTDINTKFQSAPIKSVIDTREENPEAARIIFERQDLSASVYALLLSTLPRPFLVLADGTNSLDQDDQQFKIKQREDLVNDFFLTNDNLDRSDIGPLIEEFGVNFTDGSHILKPFIVDPAIDCMVMPARNRVAVPFLLDRDDLKIEKDVSVKRPGIELIIRERLRASERVDTVFLETARQILRNEISPNVFLTDPGGTLDGQTLLSTVSALLGKFNVDESEIDELNEITRVQTRIIFRLVKTLKKMLEVLYDSIQMVLKARTDINWIPTPNREGPEFGSKGASLRVQNASSEKTEIDRTIIILKRLKIDAEHQTTEITNLGQFNSPFSVTTNDANLKLINDALAETEDLRNQTANDAFVAMGNIELIMGEVSGLGLVDVLCVYIALWSMDEDALISLLDTESFDRLCFFFPELVVGAAARRESAGGQPAKNIEAALNDFESKLKNVLTFAQIEFSRQFITAGEEESGDIYADL